MHFKVLSNFSTKHSPLKLVILYPQNKELTEQPLLTGSVCLETMFCDRLRRIAVIKATVKKYIIA